MCERVERIVQWCTGLPPRFYDQHFVLVSYFHTTLSMLYPAFYYSINIPYIYDSFQRKLQMSVIFTPKSLGLQGDQTSQSLRKSVLNVHWKDWCWSWNSSTLATWCEKLTPWKRPWCRARLKAGAEEDDRGWDGWMASLILLTQVWVGDGQGSLACCSPWGCRVRHDWATELNWTHFISLISVTISQFLQVLFYFCKNQFLMSYLFIMVFIFISHY